MPAIQKPDRKEETVMAMPNTGTRHSSRPRTHKTVLMYFKFIAMFLVTVATLAFMANRIFYWQSEHGDEFELQAIMQLINRSTRREAPIIPNRGSITDRNGQTLAFSTIVYYVFLDPLLLSGRSADRQRHTIESTSAILGIPEENLWAFLDRREDGTLVHNHHYAVIATYQPLEIHLALQNAGLWDVHTREVTTRSYVYGTMAASVIGGHWGDTLWGIERRHDRHLTGVDGRIFRSFDSTGRSVVTERIESEHGATVVTTIDLVYQQMAEDVVVRFGTQYDARFAASILMEPHTGAILAMAQYPSFNLNAPRNPYYVTNPTLAEYWGELPSGSQELATNFNSVWRNFNISHTFEPGSIHKPITVAAALEEGIIDFYDTFHCRGSLVVGGVTISCWRGIAHGTVNVRQAIAHSCNVALVMIAERMGREMFYTYHRDFGFGQLTGIDLPFEASAAALQHSLAGLNPVELATASFGQRFNATPIQAITSFASLVNGGYLMEPFVVSQVVGSRGNVLYEREPQIVRNILSHEVSEFMRCAMVDTFTYGTGRQARVYGHDVGGKSGTGEQGLQDNPNFFWTSAFVGYFPPHDPQYVLLTVIYDPQPTTPSASHMFMEMVLNIIQHRRLEPTSLTGPDGIALYDYRGVTLWQAIQHINRQGLDFSLVGNGNIVTSQFPNPGDRVSQNATIILILDHYGDYELAEVPDLLGLNVAQAREALLNAGFSVLTDYADPQNRIEELNIVVQQMPEPFQRVTPGIEVRIMGRVDWQ